MPKRTREQKIAAAYRRQIRRPSTPAGEAGKPAEMEKTNDSLPEDAGGRKTFIKDVTKSFILIAIIIISEFIVYGLALRGIIRI